MKILVEVGHPAHVHFFRHPISMWKERGHRVLVVSRRKDITEDLLRAFGIEAMSISRSGKGTVGLFVEMIVRDYRLWRLARQFRPDILTSIGGTWISQISKIVRKPAVVFYDTENAVISNAITYPLVAALCTPKCYDQRTKLGRKHLRYPGYHELSYLHPNRFNPDPDMLSVYGVSPSRTFFVVRFVSWEAGHDLRETGLGFKKRKQIITLLTKYGEVFVTTEASLPHELAKKVSVIHSEHIHHLMAFSTMVVGESATMASEAAMLGVPAFYIADTTRGYIAEQQRRYGLVYHFRNSEIDNALGKIEELLAYQNLRDTWKKKRQNMLEDMIDVSEFVVEMIDQFPTSFHHFRNRWAHIQQEN